jgi:hypothetical protein
MREAAVMCTSVVYRNRMNTADGRVRVGRQTDFARCGSGTSQAVMPQPPRPYPLTPSLHCPRLHLSHGYLLHAQRTPWIIHPQRPDPDLPPPAPLPQPRPLTFLTAGFLAALAFLGGMVRSFGGRGWAVPVWFGVHRHHR